MHDFSNQMVHVRLFHSHYIVQCILCIRKDCFAGRFFFLFERTPHETGNAMHIWLADVKRENRTSYVH